MSDVTLESLLDDYNEKRKPLFPFMANERGNVGRNIIDATPDEWLVNKAAIWLFAKEPESIGDWPEDRQRRHRANMAIYRASLDAARRFIVARDFNEFREDKWRVLAKVSAPL